MQSTKWGSTDMDRDRCGCRLGQWVIVKAIVGSNSNNNSNAQTTKKKARDQRHQLGAFLFLLSYPSIFASSTLILSLLFSFSHIGIFRGKQKANNKIIMQKGEFAK